MKQTNKETQKPEKKSKRNTDNATKKKNSKTTITNQFTDKLRTSLLNHRVKFL